MADLDQYTKFAHINRLTRVLLRNPEMINKKHQADSEIIRQPDGSYLAFTIDIVQKEFDFFNDPFVIGWSSVVCGMSDLAAVGAAPIGVLLALSIPNNCTPEWCERFFMGAQGALSKYATFCLGGDIKVSNEISCTCAAIGRILRPRPVQRTGAAVGDLFYITGSLGKGNLYAISKATDRKTWERLEKDYRPVARVHEGELLAPWMKCAIDTSAGLFQALAIIADLNKIGIHFEHRQELYDLRILPLLQQIQFPLWLVNAFGLGEYELVFAISGHEESAFLHDAKQKRIPVFKIGKVRPEPGMSIAIDGKTHEIDLPHLLNLNGSNSSIESCLASLSKYASSLR